MTIGLYNVTPAPLAGVIASDTDVWQRECLFHKGKTYRVVAPSGKGKSTFIHCVYGLRYDYAGKILIDNQEANSIKPDDWAEIRQSRISVVFQDLRLFPHLTARQNIQVKSALVENAYAVRAEEMAETLGVNGLLDKASNTLSYGERQRVAILRALIQPFEFLLLDEPFSHLDENNALKAAALINEESRKRNAGIILTSLGGDKFFQYDLELKL